MEKPVSHNVWEGRQLVNAARKYKKIVQTGTQARSSKCIQDAVQWVQAGNLGKIKVSRGLCYKRRGSIGDIPDTKDVPREVDYDLWLGPAPRNPSPANACITTGTGCGITAMATLAIRASTKWTSPAGSLATWNFPRVWSVGGRLGYEDDGETANTQVIYHDYESAPLIFEVRGLGVKKAPVPGPPTATVAWLCSWNAKKAGSPCAATVPCRPTITTTS